jgi:hypothetical protein
MPISREFNGGRYAPGGLPFKKLLTRVVLFYAAQDSNRARDGACGRDGAEAWTPTNIALRLILVALIALVPCGFTITCRNPAEPHQTTRAICPADERPVESTE